MYRPLNYNEINLIEGSINPSMVKSMNNKSFAFWERSLFHRACSKIDFELPEEWDGPVKDFFYYCLFRFGYVAVSYSTERGYFFQPCSLNGIDFYYQPTNALIANPALKESLNLKIHEECEIIKLTPDYQGIWDIIWYYAEKFSVLDNAINMSLINNKFAFMIAAKNKAAGETIKKMLDKINKGEPAVIFDSKLTNDQTDKTEPWQFWERKNLKESYLTSDQLMDFQTLLNNFDSEIGIPSVPYQKKERMVSDEATSRVNDASARPTVWKRSLESSIKLVKVLYPELNITFKFNYEEGGAEDVTVKDDTDRSL